ncbi:MAG TPA: metal-dependent hydrolase [Candidatus Hydrogenedentes bacterium]|nr:metal-dependent hydrolase [Candidatus Hydrogenedentota bacterium]
MNSPVHFCTGYLAGRALGYGEHRFEVLYMSVAAYSPDLDSRLRSISPFFSHGVWTHTIAGVVVMSLVLAAITMLALTLFKRPAPLSFRRLFVLAAFGGMTHLLLDAFTFYYSEADATHHMYFWPVWNFPWHINTMFPEATFRLRVWVEVVYSVSVATIILMYQWLCRGQNPCRMFDPRRWFASEPGAQ